MVVVRCTTAMAVLGALSTVSAHGNIDMFKADTVYNYPMAKPPNQDGIGWWTPDDASLPGQINFVDGTSYSTPDIICHEQAEPGELEATLEAGSTIEMHWSMWLPLHWGPIVNYLARCDGPCSEADKAQLKWFKFAERGLVRPADTGDVGYGLWATEELLNNGNTWKVTIPDDIAPGNYVFRTEPITLQFASEMNKAQHYPKCFNIKITGQGTKNPPGVLGTDLYRADHPGLLIDVALNPKNYSFPGPALYTGASAQDPLAAGSAPITAASGTSSLAEPTPFDFSSLASSIMSALGNIGAPAGSATATSSSSGADASGCGPLATVTVTAYPTPTPRFITRTYKLRV